MLKRLMIWTALCLLPLAACAQRADELTLLVIPRAAEPVQLAREISRSFPTLIVCYQQAGSTVQLHTWNGSRWVEINPDRYANGSFSSRAARSTVIIEPEGAPAPDRLIPDTAWCAKTYRLQSTDRNTMLYLLGRHYRFPLHIWTRFAERYNQPLLSINPGLFNIPWYHNLGGKGALREERVDKEIHMDQWVQIFPVASPSIPTILNELKKEAQDTRLHQKQIPANKPAPKPVEEAPEKALAQEPIILRAEPMQEKPPTTPKAIDPFTTAEIPVAIVILAKEE